MTTPKKYTLVGYSVDPLTQDTEFVFVHVRAAASADDAIHQLGRALPLRDIVCNVFDGHLTAVNPILPALQLVRPGVLEKGKPPYSAVKGDLIDITIKESGVRYSARVSAVMADGTFFVNGDGFGHQFHRDSHEHYGFELLERPMPAPSRRMRP